MGKAVRSYTIYPADRRGLSRTEAAEYVGVSVSLFDAMVDDRRMPRPKRFNSRLVWDRIKLDEAFSAIPDADAEPEGNPVDRMLDDYEARVAEIRSTVPMRGRGPARQRAGVRQTQGHPEDTAA